MLGFSLKRHPVNQCQTHPSLKKITLSNAFFYIFFRILMRLYCCVFKCSLYAVMSLILK